MYIFILYNNVRCPAFYPEEDLFSLLEYTDDFLSLLFKKGLNRADQIQIFKNYLDYANALIKEESPMDYIGNLNYWTSVLGLLRYKVIQDDKQNGFARAIPQEKFHKQLKDKLKTKLIRKK